MSYRSPTLLNVYEVDIGGRKRHLICFLETELAESQGINERSVVGECTPDPGDEFDLSSFQLNPGFVAAFTEYMNAEASRAPDVIAQARGNASGWLYFVDPRAQQNSNDEPPATDLLGCFAVDESGRIVPYSFQYNQNHLWFDPASGASGVFADKSFYDWLHFKGYRE